MCTFPIHLETNSSNTLTQAAILAELRGTSKMKPQTTFFHPLNPYFQNSALSFSPVLFFQIPLGLKLYTTFTLQNAPNISLA